MDEEIAQQIMQQRQLVLLLARNQFTKEQIRAAERHVRLLGRLLKVKEEEAAAAARASPAAASRLNGRPHSRPQRGHC